MFQRSLIAVGYRVAATVTLPADTTSVRSQVLQRAFEMVIVCKPCAISISEGVLPTKFPSTETSAPEGFDVICNRVMSAAVPRFYIVLDQFERVIRPYGQMPNGQEEFSAMLQRLISSIPETLTIIYVATETEIFLPTLIELKLSQNCQMVKCEPAVVAKVINKLTAQAGITLEQAIVEKLQLCCGKSDPREPFTLAHVTAICHLLCDSGDLSIASLERILEDHGDTLNRIINQYDVMGFIEDIPFDAAARALLPRMLKVISKEARRSSGGSPALVVECLTSHFGELFPKVAYVEKSHAAAIG